MSSPISVTGGDDGTSARFEDMLAVAGMLDRAARDIEEIVTVVRFQSRFQLGAGLGAADEMRVSRLLADFSDPQQPAALTALRLRGDAARLRGAVAAYQQADDDSASLIDAMSGVLVAVAVGAGALLRGRGPADAAQRALATDPSVVDTFVNYSGAMSVVTRVGPRYPDGHPVVGDLGLDRRANLAPGDLAALVESLAVRNEGLAGEVSVAFVVGADGIRRVIVDIPGTKSWNPGATCDVTSLSTNARALVGAPTSYERGVLIALARAGVRHTDPVLLVGHSEGGMVAVETARDAVRRGRFNVTHVVTAGSPIGRTVGSLPAGVRVLALENATDVVPHLDGASNPDRRNVTTVTVHHGDGTISDDHDLRDSYEPGAHDADLSANASVRDFVHSAQGFLDAAAIRTHAFVVTRAYP